MVEDEQVLVLDRPDRTEVDLTEPGRDLLTGRRAQARLDEHAAQRVDVGSRRYATQQRGLERGRAAAEERIVDVLARVSEPFDEEAGAAA